ncbi:hypothetical protein [Nocardiopsis tropica]|uniref:Uncharacterized protein n=1 Tax=Nocardiopsis tropica TaxID=109330 RepID=A0ABU7KMS1_9ACTN|nr:hypothetical protein [Nocardiopsis umidischolae]MEE2050593.1 hypothetical protein [Nocardiopsis umidischolae]
MLVGVTSVKGSPGVSTLALAMTLAWQNPVLLAELDPAGGDLRPRLMPSLNGSHQLLNLASLDSLTSRDVASQVVSLDPPQHTKVVLPGLTDPTTAPALGQTWTELADVLTSFHLRERHAPLDVIADCGRLGADSPHAVLARADVVVVVLRARLDSVALAAPAIRRWKATSHVPILPVVVQNGPYSPRDIDQTLGARSVRLHFDAKGAQALESGRWGRKLDHSPLMRGARGLINHVAKKDSRRDVEAFLAAGSSRG